MVSMSGVLFSNRKILIFSLFALVFISVFSLAVFAQEISTDKSDYSPGEIVHITGSGFEANANLQIKITGYISGSIVLPSAYYPVTTDDGGSFQYYYFLDGFVQEYKIEVLDLENNVLATHTFTDARTINWVTLNGGSQWTPPSPSSNGGSVTVAPSASITASVDVTTTGSGVQRNWKSTSYQIEGGSLICVDTNNHESAGTFTESFSITAPSSPGTYDVSFIAYSDDNNCASNPSLTLTLIDGITVNPATPPASCGNSIVETGEECDDGSLNNGDCCSSTCQYESSSTVCRASAGACDVAEVCDGVGNDCPADGFKANTFECRAVGGLCDVSEMCTGSSATCPTDTKSTAVCSQATDVCDATETCDGVNNDCPTDAKASTETLCNDNLFCTINDHCNGNGACVSGGSYDCLANNLPEIATCDNTPDNIHYTWDSRNPFTSTCDETTDSCTNGNAITITHQSPTIGVCDVACLTNDDCNYQDTLCADGVCNMDTYTCEQHFKSVGTTCREADGICDVAEVCSGSSAACPADGVKPNTEVCQASAGVCDPAEYCDGSTKTCPTDLKSTAQCRASAGDCDVAEFCDGSTNDCPTDVFKPNTEVCRDSAGQCDVAEMCTGSGTSCPDNAFVSAGTSCNDGFFCNENEVCDGSGSCGGGSSIDCSLNDIFGINECTYIPDSNPFTMDTRGAFTSVCDETADECPTGDLTINHQAPTIGVCGVLCLSNSDCSSLNDACADGVCNLNTYTCEQQFKPAQTECRAAGGVCDVAETCTGSSADCPADAKSTDVCRPSAGICDVVESCDGANNDCPTDAFLSASTVCRESAGICDVVEQCTGSSATCPTDQFQPSGTVCRASTKVCDPAEVCTGNALCPDNTIFATRSQGFWATHTAFTTSIFNTELSSNFIVGTNPPKYKTIDTQGKLFGAFWSNIAYKSAGTSKSDKRTAEDQARMILLQQLAAAKLNCAAFGCPASTQTLISNANTKYATGTKDQMTLLASQLDTYNNCGTTQPVSEGSATPQLSQSYADKGFWNIP